MDRKFRAARVWSNKELEKYACYFKGSVVNVSAWKDRDKEGGRYQDYFINAKSYSITNYGGGMGKSDGELSLPEYELDLTKPLPKEMVRKFDNVFNHTTLEHVYENRVAFRNLCEMANDAVIVIVPWVQEVHTCEGSYDDYWRYSPYAMEKLYEENGFSMVVCNHNNNFDTAVYLFCIGIRNEKLIEYSEFSKISVDNKLPAGRWIGSRQTIVQKLINIIKRVYSKKE